MKLWKKSPFFNVSYVQDSTWTLFSKRIYAFSNHNYIAASLNCSTASTSYCSISIFDTFTQPRTMTCSSRRWSTKTHSFKFSMLFSFQDRNLNSLGIKNVNLSSIHTIKFSGTFLRYQWISMDDITSAVRNFINYSQFCLKQHFRKCAVINVSHHSNTKLKQKHKT
jgi:hypothetical protein